MPDAGSALVPPIACLRITEEDHVLGLDNAEITLVEYGDMECPETSAFLDVVARLRSTFTDSLRYVFRHFPMSATHPHALQAAEAAECAAAQGRFWEMVEMMLHNCEALDARSIFDYVDQLGLDRMRVALQLGHRTFAERVQRDIETGKSLNVYETPGLFLDESKYFGPLTYDALANAIEQALQDRLASRVTPLLSRSSKRAS